MDKTIEDIISQKEKTLSMLRERLTFKTGKDGKDTSPEDMEHTKKLITECESILVSLRNGEIP